MDKRLYIASFINHNNDLNDDSFDNIKGYILDIITNYGIGHTDNINGVFINLSLMDDTIIDNIYNDMHYHMNKNNNPTTIQTTPKKEPAIKKNDYIITPDSIAYTSVDKLVVSLSKTCLTI